MSDDLERQFEKTRAELIRHLESNQMDLANVEFLHLQAIYKAIQKEVIA